MKKNFSLALTVCFCALFAFAGTVNAAEKKAEGKASSIGIVVAAFGTTKAASREPILDFTKKIAKQYPNARVALAFTSRMAVNVAKKDKLEVSSLPAALAAMADNGVKQVVILPLHIFPGQEYADIIKTAEAFACLPKGLQKIEVLSPLLAGSEALPEIADTLAKFTNERIKDNKAQAVVFMGHGGEHFGNMAYAALQYFLQQKNSNAFIGVVDGEPDLKMVMASLKKQNVKKAHLVPLMVVAGVHAAEDMAGDKDSYASAMREAGIEPVPYMHGLVENEDIIEIWQNKLAEGIRNIENPVKKEKPAKQEK